MSIELVMPYQDAMKNGNECGRMETVVYYVSVIVFYFLISVKILFSVIDTLKLSSAMSHSHFQAAREMLPNTGNMKHVFCCQ